MQVERIKAWNPSKVTAADWNRLSRGVPFRTYQWCESWWRHYGRTDARGGRNRQLFTLCVFDRCGRLAGVAPWYVERTKSRQRVVRFLGSGEVCSDYQTVLCLRETEDEVATAVAEWLCHDHPRNADDRWDTLQFSCVSAADETLGRLLSHLAERGNLVHRRPAESCWRVQLPATWNDYVAMLSKSHRKQVRRVQRRMFESGRAVHHELRTPDDLARGLDTLIDLHQRRRASLSEPGCFSSKRFTAFHREVAGRMLDLDALRLSWVELDGQPVAAEYHLAGGGVVYAYQSGLDPAVLDEEPGRLAAVATLRSAIETGQTAVDFLRGDEPYKAHWRAQPVPTLDVRVVRDKLSARLTHGAWLAGAGFKDWLKAGLAQPPAQVDTPKAAGSG
jgi:CelD/BcsL family acetyltransferase involved in cellulose biosynthesis